MKNNNDLFYTCSLIEFIGRQQKMKRSDLVSFLGCKTVKRIYEYADILHCEPIEKLQGAPTHASAFYGREVSFP